VTLLNAFLTSSKAGGEQLDVLRRLLMVERFHVWATGHDVLLRVGRTDKRFLDVWGQWTVQLISGRHAAKAWNFGHPMHQSTQTCRRLAVIGISDKNGRCSTETVTAPTGRHSMGRTGFCRCALASVLCTPPFARSIIKAILATCLSRQIATFRWTLFTRAVATRAASWWVGSSSGIAATPSIGIHVCLSLIEPFRFKPASTPDETQEIKVCLCPTTACECELPLGWSLL
jgi:hypothetical protein